MIYLIDFENVHEEGFSSLGRLGEKDAVYCFFTRNVAKISMAALAGMRSGQLHFIEAESGKQSLDLALVSYLGYLIGTVPNELNYEIVSNDNGFAKAAEFWNKHGNGLRVRVRKTTEQKPKDEISVPAPAKPARRRKTAKTPVPVPAVKEVSAPVKEAPAAGGNISAKPAPASENKPVVSDPEAAEKETPAPTAEKPTSLNTPSEGKKDPGSLAAVIALSAAGIEEEVSRFLISEAQKYSADKNIKQLVYRSLVKKYGQKEGLRIYDIAKKVVV